MRRVSLDDPHDDQPEPGHGTPVGFLRHVARSEPGCPECAQAWRAWQHRDQAQPAQNESEPRSQPGAGDAEHPNRP